MQLLHPRHPGHPADQDHVLDLLLVDLRLLQRPLADGHGALDQVAGQLFQLFPGQRPLQVQRLVLAGGDDEWEVDLGLAQRRQLALGLLGHVLEPL